MTELQILAIGGPIWAAVVVGAVVLVSSYFDDRAMAREQASALASSGIDRPLTQAAPVVPPDPNAPAKRQDLADLHTRFATLSPREHEILELLGAGLGNKQIAAKLTMSDHTVKIHIRNMLRKLNALNRSALVDLAAAASDAAAPATRPPVHPVLPS
ncbi:LuxR C-terminal-related transcriptional regulator [Tardiphaga robiniae]|uniref:HTH luxR-type domain-containing protein n=1 Tax=Tardiphaga robiniae TaxID=943830 RepID=A0A7G6TZD4_9BRAD|nr:helix-turn-helix transcriptional regulator [Tardiphaga robiniae]QND72116.1 hypothetical protein HB776_13470 [Tardiphaga robiniae]